MFEQNRWIKVEKAHRWGKKFQPINLQLNHLSTSVERTLAPCSCHRTAGGKMDSQRWLAWHGRSHILGVHSGTGWSITMMIYNDNKLYSYLEYLCWRQQFLHAVWTLRVTWHGYSGGGTDGSKDTVLEHFQLELHLRYFRQVGPCRSTSKTVF